MDKQWGGYRMQKYIDNLDDFEDDRRSRLLEITERWLMPAVIFVAGVIIILAVCARLEAL